MTTIHMEIQGVQRVRRELESAERQIQDQLNALRRLNQGLSGEWIANSASEYISMFHELESRLTTIKDRLDELSGGLAGEIVRYQQIDRDLG